MSAVESEYRFLALGDSYTIGEGVIAAQRWPAQLVARLREEAIMLADADIVATTGWTTDELQQALDAREFTPPYALVSLLVGVNNQYRGRHPDNFRSELSVLVDFALDMAAGDARKVLLLSIPDWGVTRFAAEQNVDAARIAEDIDCYNTAVHELSRARGTHWVDVTGLSRGPGRNLLADDGLHPSAEQYALWVEAILPVVRGMFSTT